MPSVAPPNFKQIPQIQAKIAFWWQTKVNRPPEHAPKCFARPPWLDWGGEVALWGLDGGLFCSITSMISNKYYRCSQIPNPNRYSFKNKIESFATDHTDSTKKG